jgi:phage shock protein E
MKNYLFILFTTMMVLFTGACSVNQPKSPSDAKSFLVDVRTPDEFAEGSVVGAVNIPLNEIESRIKEFEGKNEIIVFCRSGNRSSQAQSILQQHGIQHVVNGGTWQQVAQTMQQQ